MPHEGLPLLPNAQTLSTSASALASLTKRANTFRSLAGSGLAACVRQGQAVRTVAAAAQVSLRKSVQKLVTPAVASILVTYTSIKVVLRTLTVTVSLSVSLVKQAQKQLALTAGAFVSVTKQAQKLMPSIAASMVATYASIKVILRTLTVTVSVSVSRLAAVQAFKNATGAVVTACGKAASVTRASIVSAAVAELTKRGQATRAATASTTVSIRRQANAVHAVSLAVSVRLGKLIGAIRRVASSLLAALTTSGGSVPVVTTRTRPIALDAFYQTSVTFAGRRIVSPSLMATNSTAQNFGAVA